MGFAEKAEGKLCLLVKSFFFPEVKVGNFKICQQMQTEKSNNKVKVSRS